MTGHDRLLALNAFFEHLGLIAGLVAVVPLAYPIGFRHHSPLRNNNP
jgi:hypothetical protein